MIIKVNANYKNRLPGLLLLTLGIILFVSCSKEKGAGMPQITSVRSVDAKLADSSFLNALPGSLIVIEGNNLSNAQEIFFNGYPAIFNPTYNTNTHIIVQIPLNTPTPDKDPNVSGVIRLVTKAGATDFSFAVIPPAPVLKEVYNENPAPGSVVEIKGMFLLSVDSVIFPGNLVSTDIETNDSGTVITVKVPENLTEAGRLIVKSPYGSDSSGFLINNTKGPGVFANFNNPGEAEFGWAWWGAVKTDDNSLYPYSDKYYIRSAFENVAAGNYGWWENNRNVAMANSNKVLVKADDLGNSTTDYNLKFEINTLKPITKGVIFLLGFGAGDKRASYTFYPSEIFGQNGVFDTGNEWKTIKISLGEIKKTNIGSLLNDNGSIGDFHLGIYSGEDPIPEFDAAFDNFRLEKNSK